MVKRLLNAVFVFVLAVGFTVSPVFAHKKKPDDIPVKPKPPIHKPRKHRYVGEINLNIVEDRTPCIRCPRLKGLGETPDWDSLIRPSTCA